jgi:hypothetical protein
MTDRFKALTVVLENEIREDDAQHLLNAIMMLKGVISVQGNVINPDHWIAQETAKLELRKKLWEALK